LSSKPVDEVIAQLERAGVPVEFGPAERTTALGARSVSVYIRDPDGNLLEFMCPRDEN
jgi:catechol 2,3-dioxygenase-like lactoylglutathione lyase family enzyme